MIDGKVTGYFLLGQNPAVGSAHGRAQRLGMANLDWLVVRDLFEIESASFWKDSPEVATGEIVPEECRTEVFLFPAASYAEKEGTFTQTQRMLQWREKAVDPPGDCRSELWFFYHLGRMVRERLAGSTDERDRPVLDLAWDYPVHDEGVLGTEGAQAWGEPSAEAVLKEINGYEVATGRPLSTFVEMKADGSTAGGCWIYTGVFADGVNQANRRKSRHDQSFVAPEWGWAWPLNRRILYNRASADPDGQAVERAQGLRLVGPGEGRGGGVDRARRPRLREDEGAVLPGARGRPRASRPSRASTRSSCRATGRVRSTCRRASSTDRCPPTTSRSSRRSATRSTGSRPTRRASSTDRNDNQLNPAPPEEHSDVFPFVFTTSRLTEHHTAGGMSRYVEHLAELQPEMFVEVSPALAQERGLEHMGWCHVVTARSAVEGRVHGDRAAPAAADRGTYGSPGLDALPLGRRWPRHRRLGQRPVRHLARPQRPHPGEQGRHLRRTSGAAAHRCRRCASSSPTTPDGPGSATTSTPGSSPRQQTPRHGRSRPPRPATTTRRANDRPQQPLRAARPGARRGLHRRAQAQGLLHRHQRLHRLQGLRGGVQGVERRPGEPLRDARHVLRQQPLAQRQPVAPRRVHREARVQARRRPGDALGRRAGERRRTRTTSPTSSG